MERPAGRSRDSSASKLSDRTSCGAHEHKWESLSSQILMVDPNTMHNQYLLGEKVRSLMTFIPVLSWFDLIEALIIPIAGGWFGFDLALTSFILPSALDTSLFHVISKYNFNLNSNKITQQLFICLIYQISLLILNNFKFT